MAACTSMAPLWSPISSLFGRFSWARFWRAPQQSRCKSPSAGWHRMARTSDPMQACRPTSAAICLSTAMFRSTPQHRRCSSTSALSRCMALCTSSIPPRSLMAAMCSPLLQVKENNTPHPQRATTASSQCSCIDWITTRRMVPRATVALSLPCA